MRDTVKHPVTKEEIVECLRTLSKELATHWEPETGDMRPMLLEFAAMVIENTDFDLKRTPAELEPAA